MGVLVAVDGGGSRCRFAAFSESGELLARLSIDHHASLSISPEAAWHTIEQGVLSLRAKLKQPREWQPDLLMMGLAGSLQENRCAELLQLIPQGLPHRLVTDGHAQLMGASGGEPGICLAVGTGSVLHWHDAQGKDGMAGGWGYPLGDEGSGAWLGMRLMQKFVGHIDGYTQNSTLIPALEERVGKTPSDIQHWTTQSKASVLAQLAPLVFEHASSGDKLAQSILNEAVGHCMSLIKLAPDNLSIYVVGGVGDQLRPMLVDLLPGRIEKAKGDALHGLWQLAKQSGGAGPLSS